MKRTLTILFGVAAVVVCVSLLNSEEAEGQSDRFNIDSFFDITYSIEFSPEGEIGVEALGITRDGYPADVPTDVARVIHAGDFTKIYVSHPGETLITEIDAVGSGVGRDLQISGLRVLQPKKSEHRGHVTVLK